MKTEKTLDIYKLLYYSTFVLCMLNFLRCYSLWSFYESIGRIIELLSAGLTIVLFPFVFFRYKGNSMIMLVTSLLLVLLVGIYSEKLLFLWSSFVLVTGAKELSFRNIVKVHFIVCLCFCLLNVLGYEMGVLKQANNYIDDIREGMTGDFVQRVDYGYGWATDFANHVLFILLDLWILLKGKLGLLWGSVYIAMAFVVIFESDARLSAGLILLIVIISLYLKWKDYRHKLVGKFVKWSIIVSIPLSVLISLWATMSYEPSNLYWFGANYLFSNRLQLSSDAVIEFGISWFGQPVELHGALDAGGGNEYNFVDNSYIQFLIRYGIIFNVLLLFLLCKIAIKAMKKDDVVLLFAIFVVGLSGIFAQFVYDFRFCVILLAFMATHNQVQYYYEDRNTYITARK